MCVCVFVYSLCVYTPNFSLYSMYTEENDSYVTKFVQPYYQVFEQAQRGVSDE